MVVFVVLAGFIVFAALETAFAAFPTAFTAVFAAFASVLVAFAAAFTALPTVFAVLAALLVVFVVLVASGPQAIPNALKAKSVESAIIFFITELVLLSSSKINLLIFTKAGFYAALSQTKHLILEHWTI